MRQKKGISNVVATVLLILLSVIAVVGVGTIVIPLVRDGLTGSTECVDYRDYFTFEEEFGYNCYNSSAGGTLYAISVRGAAVSDEIEGEIKGFKLVFLSSTDSEGVDVENGGSLGIIRMVNSSLPLSVPGSGEVKTYVFQGMGGLEKAEIAPRLKSGKLCEVSDRVRVQDPCGSAILEVS